MGGGDGGLIHGGCGGIVSGLGFDRMGRSSRCSDHRFGSACLDRPTGGWSLREVCDLKPPFAVAPLDEEREKGWVDEKEGSGWNIPEQTCSSIDVTDKIPFLSFHYPVNPSSLSRVALF
ncbi:hypothetical protein M0R45_025482 [Rubus argutus]|uniref:Uncharacterized protein n=1 Tax=Rubus argutus TaxID=59490 RepID=A0AAW1WW31_RUBAR